MSNSDVDQDDILDDEIIEIFAEEVDEVIEQVNALLPRWSEDPADKSAADEIRRAFHTLKGSGRMVRADEVSELAWAMESMLNRVVDGSVPLTDPMLALVESVSQVIPSLVDAYKNHQASVLVGVDIDLLISQANTLEKGESIEDASVQTPPLLTTADDDNVAASSFILEESVSIDPELFEAVKEQVESLSDSFEKISDHMRRLHEEMGNIRSDIPAMASDSDIRELTKKMQAVNKDVQDLKYFVKTGYEKALEDNNALGQSVSSQLKSSEDYINEVRDEIQSDMQQASAALHSVRGSIIGWSCGAAVICSSIAAAAVYVLLAM